MDEQGYYEDRFVSVVPRDLICGICLRVLREPRLCEDGEHAFCLPCISRYLKESQTCPQCRKRLTTNSLVHPQSYLRKSLGELRIKCDYIKRGCFDQIQLGNLPDHVKLCGFAPMTCGNCNWEINRKDKDYHEKSSCQFGATKCQDCEKMKKKLTQTNRLLLKNAKESVDNQRMHKYLGENLHDLKRKHDQVEENLKSMNESLNESERKRDKLEENLKSMNKSLNESERKRNQLEIDVREMKQQFEPFAEKFNQVADQPSSNFSSEKEIIIMGGDNGEKVENSVTVFNPANGTYAKLPPLNYPRHSASSCVYNNDVIVAGGGDGNKNYFDNIEILRINQDLPRWTISNSRLPDRLTGHVLKVYQGKLLVIGGEDSEGIASNEINELALNNPYTPTLLATMPQARANHAAEIVDDKLFILGGTTNTHDAFCDSVMVYDFITKEFKTWPSLPKPVGGFSTVTWGKKIIVIGGQDKDQSDLSDVIMYDIESEHWEHLPSLRHGRTGHSTVIIDDVIFVFGGWNSQQGALNLVESFTMRSDGWKELPAMKEMRSFPTGVVKP